MDIARVLARARGTRAREKRRRGRRPAVSAGQSGKRRRALTPRRREATARKARASRREMSSSSLTSRAVRSRVSTTTRGRRTRAGTRDVIDRVRADATLVNVPRDAPADPLRALKGVEITRAVDGARVTVPDLVDEDGTTVVTFLRSFG